MSRRSLPLALPLVGVSSCVHKSDTPKPFHAVDDKYLRAVSLSVEAMPLVIPALGELLDIPGLVSTLDGIMLTGSASNVFPKRYNKAPSKDAEPYDLQRDETTLLLIQEALRQEVPLLAICRGFQELNVALGGSLHPQINKIEGRMDHSSPNTNEMEVDYGPSHPIDIQDGCLLSDILKASEAQVNSLHYQAIDQLGDGLVVDAQAADGTVEAISLPRQRSFVLGVQWHPEYKSVENAVSAKIFKAFGDAVRARAGQRG
ncbi:gamma-glutamyl-gamma-aminobutyrate hydrolase family protein [Kiloniella laminariae]|uniref:Gamma-glutamyl-gamma-aminobutyrate hydrolase family protein n=1 Tax=Kiloniella laminariae TaxID=454162 RepID=A0ABT4LJ57_9PROT|nr:gamma-glutamyl-gamma-aminobutyrate hydrolase family protein [Kiloniella laminariae]MCZ4281141.1 gamma-glutamyl-gamma-aminobutyrate hydrolase family protein [Kiloniella laminariae]